MVVGLPRTATTLAHNILAGAPGARGPMLWELMHTSLPFPIAKQRKVIRSVDNAMRMVTALAPAMRDIHPNGPSARRMRVLPASRRTTPRRAPLPGYEKWLREHDFAPDYRYLKQGLQVLQHGRDRRWVLKCPTHSGRLDLILKLFPDATIVWTHRDPVTVVGSICSLVETSRAMHLRRLATTTSTTSAAWPSPPCRAWSNAAGQPARAFPGSRSSTCDTPR